MKLLSNVISRHPILWVLLIVLGSTNSALSGGVVGNSASVDVMAEELVKLRSDVEELSSELDNKKNSYKSRMLMLENQRAELDANIKREVLSIKQQQLNVEKNKKRIKELGSDSSSLNPVLLASIEDIKSYVETTLPFKRSERLKALDKIKEQLIADVIDAEKAANRLWAFVEDEIRMTKENGIYRQTVVIKDKEILADVARLGMVFMYFEMVNEEYGYVKRTAEDFSYEIIHDSTQKKQVATLFDSLRKQIRQGFFELPNISQNTSIQTLP